MKRTLILAVGLMLTACSGTAPNLVHSDSPILNIAENLATSVEAKADRNSAWIKNKSAQPLKVNYHLFWYNAQGVTQVREAQRESLSGNLYLQPQEQKAVELIKPTSESTNYRLYLQ